MNRRNRSKERLDRIYWYICLRWYDPETIMGKIFSAARLQQLAAKKYSYPHEGIVFPPEWSYWRWRNG